MTSENAYFLALGDERLFAFLHHPAVPCRGGVVLCAPLAEEKLWSHRVFVSFARELCGLGYAVLRFDYRGEGDSDRQFEQSDLQTRIEDTVAAIDDLKRRLGLQRVTIVGLRLGAAIAALAAAGREDVERLVLWDPVTNGADYMQSVLRSNLMAQMALHRKVVESREVLIERLERGETINVEGYGLREPLFGQVSRIRLDGAFSPAAARILIVSIAAREAPAREDLTVVGASWSGAAVATAIEEPFWREIRSFYRRAENLFRVTLDWLGATP